MESKAETKDKAKTKPEKKFTKANILKSKAYKDKQDLIHALLDGSKTYSKKEVDSLIKSYLEKEV